MRARIFKRYLGVLPMSVITNCRGLTILLAAVVMFGAGREALAQKKYDVGASDTEIKIGNIVPYSGPASAYGTVGKAMAAVFRKVNDEGGINGRKINFISYDDAYSPPKAVEQARKLIESDEVLLLFGTLGTASNSAIQKYRSEEHTSELQSRSDLVCRLLLEKKKNKNNSRHT